MIRVLEVWAQNGLTRGGGVSPSAGESGERAVPVSLLLS